MSVFRSCEENQQKTWSGSQYWNSDEHWWLARKVFEEKYSEKGLIPSNYVILNCGRHKRDIIGTATTICDNKVVGPFVLSFKSGDKLNLLNCSHNEIWLASKFANEPNHEEGFVSAKDVIINDGNHKRKSKGIVKCLVDLNQEDAEYNLTINAGEFAIIVDESSEHFFIGRHADYNKGLQEGKIPRQHVISIMLTEINRSSIIGKNRISDCPPFAHIWNGTWENNEVTVKTIYPGKRTLCELLYEAEIMRQCNHDHIARFCGVCIDKEPFSLVTYDNTDIDLKQVLRNEGQKLTILQKMDIAIQVASALVYLEASNVVHRDLQTRKIGYVDEGFHFVKILDFSFARKLEANSTILTEDNKYILPVKWAAQESLTSNRFSLKSDIWSFGVFLLELVTCGQDPYPDMSNTEVREFLANGYRHPKPVDCPSDIYDIMIQCWQEDPKERPSAAIVIGKLKSYLTNDYVSGDISISELDIQEEITLSSSQHYTIRKGLLSQLHTVAIKSWKLFSNCPIYNLLSEAEILMGLKHRNIISILGVCFNLSDIYIVLEFTPKGNLLDFLWADNGQNLGLTNLVDFAKQIAAGMEYIESKQVVHRNLKACSVVVSENEVIKISDFYMARHLEGVSCQMRFSDKFKPKWTAVEVYRIGQHTIKSDVWSYGVVLYELITFGQEPYTGLSNLEVVTKVQKGYRMEKPSTRCPDIYYEMMAKCWKEDPEERPSFTELHKFFDNSFFVPGQS